MSNLTYNRPFLAREDLAAIVPAALASTHDGMRSSRYVHIPTVDIINSMETHGWKVAAARAPKGRTSAVLARTSEFGIHQLEFQDPNAKAISDPRAPNSKAIFPRIHVINSHNGTSRFEILAGLYALVCSNGLMISTGSVGEFSTRHSGKFDAEEAHRIIEQFRSRMGYMGETIEKWHAVTLSPDRQRDFAIGAARIRWNKPEDIMPEPEVVLAARRPEDAGSDLWSVFNRAQENIIGGGFKRSRREARPIKHLRESNRINSELWDLATSFAS